MGKNFKSKLKPRYYQYLGIFLGSILGIIVGIRNDSFIDFFIWIIFGFILGYVISLSSKGPLNYSTLSNLDPLRKFPFKYMIAIVGIMDSKESRSLSQIREVSGACTSDSLETLEMMQYLTTQGQIINEDGMWRKNPNIQEDIKPPKRVFYLNSMITIMNSLTTEGKDLTELQQLNIVPPSHLEEYLRFLAIITAKGIVRYKINLLDKILQHGRIFIE